MLGDASSYAWRTRPRVRQTRFESVPDPPRGKLHDPVEGRHSSTTRSLTGQGEGCLRMDMETDNEALFQTKGDCKSASPMFKITVADPSGSKALAHAGVRAGYAFEEASQPDYV